MAQEIDQVGEKARDKIDKIDNEETTKHALVIPFIKALGYEVYDSDSLNEIYGYADHLKETVGYYIEDEE